jgi:hypothetical protein
MFNKRIDVVQSKVVKDGQKYTLDILKARLIKKKM